MLKWREREPVRRQNLHFLYDLLWASCLAAASAWSFHPDSSGAPRAAPCPLSQVCFVRRFAWTASVLAVTSSLEPFLQLARPEEGRLQNIAHSLGECTQSCRHTSLGVHDNVDNDAGMRPRHPAGKVRSHEILYARSGACGPRSQRGLCTGAHRWCMSLAAGHSDQNCPVAVARMTCAQCCACDPKTLPGFGTCVRKLCRSLACDLLDHQRPLQPNEPKLKVTRQLQ